MLNDNHKDTNLTIQINLHFSADIFLYVFLCESV